ncbi:MAG: lipoate--protein ligase family protein [Ardenticatenaceae bacterium]
MAKRTIRLLTESYTDRPAFDTAVSRSILRKVSDGDEPETLRLYRPGRIVAFGPQDTRAPGYKDAIAIARKGGFQAVNRLAGGRAAVFHEDTIAFSWAIPDTDPKRRVQERFEEIADIMARAFRQLGVDAYVGEIEGEYCPGKYSVNARGKTKLMGVAQRIAVKAAHVGGVVVVDGSSRVRDILIPVYEALELDWNPATTGSVRDEVASVTYQDVHQAILDQFAKSYALTNGSMPLELVELAETMAAEHLAS